MNEIITKLKERMEQNLNNNENLDILLTIKRNEEDNVKNISISLKKPKE